MAAVACVLITAPERLARHDGHHMLLVDERTPRGGRVECVERPMRDDPHDQLLWHIRSAVAEYERTFIAERMRRGRQARVWGRILCPACPASPTGAARVVPCRHPWGLPSHRLPCGAPWLHGGPCRGPRARLTGRRRQAARCRELSSMVGAGGRLLCVLRRRRCMMT